MRGLAALAILSLPGCVMEYGYAVPGDHYDLPGEAPELERPVVSDPFLEGSPQPVDLVFMIDRSGSMNNEVLDLYNAIPQFLDTLYFWDLDFNLGVMSTEDGYGYSGSLTWYFGNQFITEDTPDADQVFYGMSSLAPGWGEAGLGTAVNTVFHWEPDFYRDRVPLHYIVISDEEDQSGLSTEHVVSILTDQIQAEKGRPATLSAIVNTSTANGCNVPSNYVGNRYMEVAQKTGGVIADICDDDWVTILDIIADLALQDRNEYFLRSLPVVDTIEVQAELDNGVTLVFGPDEWEYRPTRNSVIILDWEQPENSRVNIQYELASF